MVPALLLASTMAIAPSTPPVSGGRILVLDTVAPELAAAEREQIDARVLAVLAAGELPLASKATHDAASECTTTICRERTATDRGVTHWVRAAVEGERRRYRVTVSVGTIADSIEGAPIASSRGECHGCNVDELVAATAAQTSKLRASLSEASSSAPVETVEPTPATPRMLRPTQAERDGVRTPQDVARVDVMRPTGIALLAVGSATAIGGAVLLGLDSQENRRTCAVDDRDRESADCRLSPQTLGTGIAMLSGGVLAVAGGITLVSIERRRRRADVRMRLGYNRIVISGRF